VSTFYSTRGATWSSCWAAYGVLAFGLDELKGLPFSSRPRPAPASGQVVSLPAAAQARPAVGRPAVFSPSGLTNSRVCPSAQDRDLPPTRLKGPPVTST
jgi:hypothetical protein